MTPIRFGEIADENPGLRRVAYEITLHFKDAVPGGFPMVFNYFLSRQLLEPRIHLHKETDPFPPTDGGNLCFIPWVNLSTSGVQMDTNPHTKSRKSPLEVLSEIISTTPDDAYLRFGNVFVVKYDPNTTTYSTEIHQYPPAFFQTIVLKNPELLRMVVHKHIRINNVQLELTPEALVGYFMD